MEVVSHIGRSGIVIILLYIIQIVSIGEAKYDDLSIAFMLDMSLDNNSSGAPAATHPAAPPRSGFSRGWSSITIRPSPIL